MKEVVIGFLGCGNVGGGVWSLLTGFSREIAHRDSLSIRIKRVLVRDVNKTRACGVPHELLTTNADDVVSDPEISIVVPCFNEADSLKHFWVRLGTVMSPVSSSWEVVFINDGSTDATLSILMGLKPPSGCTVQIVDFSRNFGKEAAITAGLDGDARDKLFAANAERAYRC